MYRITYITPAGVELIVFNNGEFNELLDCREATLTMGVNTAWSLSLELGRKNPAWSEVELMRGEFRVYEGAYDEFDILFRGRPFRVKREYDGTLNIEVEGMLAVLNDAVGSPTYRPGSGADRTVSGFMSWLFETYAANLNTMFDVGTVEFEDNIKGFQIHEPLTIWEILLEKTLKLFGGYLIPDYNSPDTVYINYYSTLPASGQKIVMAQNLLDMTDEKNGADIVTDIMPRAREGVVPFNSPDGTYSGFIKLGNLLIDPDARALYGRITRVVEFDDVSNTTELLNAAIAYLQQPKIAESVEVSALDMSFITSDEIQPGFYFPVEPFRPGTLVDVYYAASETDAVGGLLTEISDNVLTEDEFEILIETKALVPESMSIALWEVSVDLVDPASSKIKLGAEQGTMSGKVAETAAAQAAAGSVAGMSIIYTNSSPSSSQSSGELSASDIMGFNLFFVEVCWSTSYTSHRAGAWVFVPSGSVIAHPSVDWYEGGGVAHVYRQVTIDRSAGTITVGTGNRATVAGITESGSYAVVTAILGTVV